MPPPHDGDPGAMGGSSSKVRAEGPTADAPLSGEKKSEEDFPKVDYFKLYSNADRTDYLLMAIGTVGALSNGEGRGCRLLSSTQ